MESPGSTLTTSTLFNPLRPQGIAIKGPEPVVQKGMAGCQETKVVPADTGADQKRLSTRGPTTPVLGTTCIPEKKDLSRRDKLPHAATPIQGESYRPSSTPSFYSYLLTPAPDTTAISGGEKSNEPRMTRRSLVIRSLEMTMVSHRGRTGDFKGAGRQEELHLLKSHPSCG